MGPEVAAIAFAAAATGGAGLNFIGETRAAKGQRRVDLAAIELQQEQFRLQAAEASSLNANNFRKALASQVALASMRGGGGSVVRQFGAESYSNFLQDQEAIKRGVRLSDLQAGHNKATAFSKENVARTKALGNFVTSAASAWNPYGISQNAEGIKALSTGLSGGAA
jgi:hypothetical protein